MSEKKRLLKGVAVLMGGTAGGQLFAVLLSPVLSRLFTREDYGILGAFALLLTFLSPIVGGRYELAIPVAENDQESTNTLGAALVSTVFVSILVGGLLVFIGPWLLGSMGRPEAAPYLLLLPLSLIAVGCYQGLNYWAIREKEYALTARTKLVQGIMLGLAQLGAGLLRTGPVGLILGDVIGRASGSGTLAIQVWRRRANELKALNLNGVKASARKFRDYPRFAAPSALLHASASALPGLVFGIIYNAAALGLFFFSYRYLWTPISLLGQTLAQVYTGEGADLAKRDPAKLERGYWSIVKKLALFGLLPFGLIALAGPVVFGWVFGENFADAGRFAQMLALGWYAQFVVGPVLPTLNFLEKQRWMMVGDGVGVVLIAGVFWGAWSMGWEAPTTLLYYSGMVVVMYGLLLWLGGRAVRERVQASSRA